MSVNILQLLVAPHLHATLFNLLDEVTRVGGGLQVERVLAGPCCGHGLHPLLWPRHHHVHVCHTNTVTIWHTAQEFNHMWGASHQRTGPVPLTSWGTLPWDGRMWCWVQSAFKWDTNTNIWRETVVDLAEMLPLASYIALSVKEEGRWIYKLEGGINKHVVTL